MKPKYKRVFCKAICDANSAEWYLREFRVGRDHGVPAVSGSFPKLALV